MPLLTLIRGLPGSGKSTFAKMLINAGVAKYHLEADMYFIDAAGNYVWSASKIKEAHKWCLENTMNALIFGDDVVVSNTFTTFKEIEPYISAAKALGARYDIITQTDTFQNVHNVPAETLARMAARFEDQNDWKV